MSAEECQKKLDELGKYVPFLVNMISRLKTSEDKPREAQVKKMEALHKMLTDRKKK